MLSRRSGAIRALPGRAGSPALYALDSYAPFWISLSDDRDELTSRQPDVARHARDRDGRTSCADACAYVWRLHFSIPSDVRHVEVNLTADMFGAEVCVDVALECNLDGATHALDMNALRAQANKRSVQPTTYARHVKGAVHLTKSDVATDAVHSRLCTYVAGIETSTDAAHL